MGPTAEFLGDWLLPVSIFILSSSDSYRPLQNARTPNSRNCLESGLISDRNRHQRSQWATTSSLNALSSTWLFCQTFAYTLLAFAFLIVNLFCMPVMAFHEQLATLCWNFCLSLLKELTQAPYSDTPFICVRKADHANTFTLPSLSHLLTINQVQYFFHIA